MTGRPEPSPVPSDARLWPGELPFTAFGQFGEGLLDLRVYEQDTWWVDRQGRPHRLEDMPFEYQANVVMFLRDQAQGHHLAMVMRVVAQELGDRLLGLEPLEGPTGRELLGMDPRQWQESTPLMTRLVSLACAETQG